MSTLLQGAPQMAAAFAGASVEAVEAVTIVLAAGVVRGWRATLAGAAPPFASTLALRLCRVSPWNEVTTWPARGSTW